LLFNLTPAKKITLELFINITNYIEKK